MTSENCAEATRHLEEARTAITTLDALYAARPFDKAAIASHHETVRQSIKLAQVEALLYIGGMLAELVPGRMPGVEGRPLSPEQLDQLEQMMTRKQKLFGRAV